MTLQSRLGGHIVSGHIDGTAKLKTIQKDIDFYNLTFELDKNLMKYIVKKGAEVKADLPSWLLVTPPNIELDFGVVGVETPTYFSVLLECFLFSLSGNA